MLLLLFTTAFASQPASWDLTVAPDAGMIRVWSWDMTLTSDNEATCNACVASPGADACFPSDGMLKRVEEVGSMYELAFTFAPGAFDLPSGYTLPNDADGNPQTGYCAMATSADLSSSGLMFKGYEESGGTCDTSKPLMHNSAAITWEKASSFCSGSTMIEFAAADNNVCTVEYKAASSMLGTEECADLDTPSIAVINQMIPVGVCTHKKAEYAGSAWEYTSEKLDGTTTQLAMTAYSDLTCTTQDSVQPCATVDGQCVEFEILGIKSFTSIDDVNNCVASATLSGTDPCTTDDNIFADCELADVLAFALLDGCEEPSTCSQLDALFDAGGACSGVSSCIEDAARNSLNCPSSVAQISLLFSFILISLAL